MGIISAQAALNRCYYSKDQAWKEINHLIERDSFDNNFHTIIPSWVYGVIPFKELSKTLKKKGYILTDKNMFDFDIDDYSKGRGLRVWWGNYILRFQIFN